ncbi:zinc finger domain-containing protein [Kineococcus glutinatus]|uniref:DNA-binding phage zinc finger domain-containing protein n=1 Tax=Kineococcus glutinatus TaxID=1070872 RepID=A0ABP9HMQ9_9ACTN
MTVTAFARREARETAAPALRVACPTCAAVVADGCRNARTGTPLSGGVHPMRIGAAQPVR